MELSRWGFSKTIQGVQYLDEIDSKNESKSKLEKYIENELKISFENEIKI